MKLSERIQNAVQGGIVNISVLVEWQRDAAKLEAENEAAKKMRNAFGETAYGWYLGEENRHLVDEFDALLKGEDESMSLSEAKEKYLPNRDIEDLRKKPDISLLTGEDDD